MSEAKEPVEIPTPEDVRRFWAERDEQRRQQEAEPFLATIAKEIGGARMPDEEGMYYIDLPSTIFDGDVAFQHVVARLDARGWNARHWRGTSNSSERKIKIWPKSA